ncbi:MAG TPA: hypothetical protein VK772_09325 [Puia sp.]|nr:hypothetical protein [Puia sp.]
MKNTWSGIIDFFVSVSCIFNVFFGKPSGNLRKSFGSSRRTPEEPTKKSRSNPEADMNAERLTRNA